MAGEEAALEFVARLRDEATHAARQLRRELDRLGGQTKPVETAVVAKDQASGTLDRVKGSLRGLVTGATLVGGALGGVAVAGGLMGLKTAASMEQARISFETMLGSATKADAFLRDLQKFAAATPFEFPELQTAASSLISAGVEASKVIPIMTTLGDVTSGMGTGSEGVQRATIALQQMTAAGKITGEDLNQLRDAGIPVFDLLAAATGKTKAEVVALAQAGKLGGKDLASLMGALETGKGLERFSGLMAKQSTSLTGLWSTFKDTVNMTLAGLVTPAIPAIKRGLGTVSGAVTTASAAWSGKLAAGSKESQTSAAQFVYGIKGLVAAFRDGDVTSDGFVGGMERAGVAARQAGEFVRDVIVPEARNLATIFREAVLPVVEQVAMVVGGVFVGALKVADPIIEATAHHADQLKTPLLVLVGIYGAYRGAVLAVAAADKVRAAAAWISTVAQVAGGKATETNTALTVAQRVAVLATSAALKVWAAAQWALNVAMSANPLTLIVLAVVALVGVLILAYRHSETFRKIVQAAMAGVMVAVHAAADAFAAVGHAVEAAVGFVAGLPGRALDALKALPGVLVGALKFALNAMLTVIATELALMFFLWVRVPILAAKALLRLPGVLVGAGKAAFRAFVALVRLEIAGVVAIVATLPGLIWKALSGLAGLLVNGARAIFDAYIGVWRWGITTVVGVVKALPGLAAAAVSNLAHALASEATAAFSAMVGAVRGGIGSVVGEARALPGQIIAGIGNASDLLHEVGLDVVRGLVNGIKGAASWIADAARDLVEHIPGPIRKLLKIGSPSKVMEEIGHWSGIGLANGLGKTEKQVRATSNRIADALMVRARTGKITTDQRDAALRLLRAQEATAVAAIRVDAAKTAGAKIGKAFAGGFGKTVASVKATAARVLKATTDAVKGGKITKGQGDTITAALKRDTAALLPIAAAREVITKRLAAASAKLQAIRSARAELTTSTRDAARSYADITKIDSPNGAPKTAGFIAQGLEARLAAIKRFMANVAALRKRGLNATSLREIVDAGVEGGGSTAAALVAGNAGQIQQVNAAQAQITKATKTLGDQAGAMFYASGERAASGLVKGLTAKAGALDAAATRIGNALAVTISHTTGAKIELHHVVSFSGPAPAHLKARDVADIIARDPAAAKRLESALAPVRAATATSTVKASR